MVSKSQEDIEVELLEKICLLYDISVNDLKFLVAIDYNFVYEFTKDNKEYILTRIVQEIVTDVFSVLRAVSPAKEPRMMTLKRIGKWFRFKNTRLRQTRR